MSDTCMTHIERYWQTLSLRGNAAYDQKDYSSALSHYTDALYRAEVLNQHREECSRLGIPFMQVFIISCNNLASTHDAMGSEAEAKKLYQRPVYFLLHLMTESQIDQDEVQRELQRATTTFLDFMKERDLKEKDELFYIRLQEHLHEVRSLG